MRPRLLIFDLDGTLIDSTTDLCNSVNAMLEHLGKPTLPSAVIASYVGDGAAMLVRRALGDPNDLDSPHHDERVLQNALNFFIHYYRQHKLDNTLLYPGVLDALQTIRTASPNILMAVLTNKPFRPSREICHELGIGDFFFQNYGGDSFDTKKPDPQGFQAIVAEASIRLLAHDEPALIPEEVVMIGDSDVDILTGRNGGARTIGCLFGINPEATQRAEPDTLVAQPSEWPTALGLQS